VYQTLLTSRIAVDGSLKPRAIRANLGGGGGVSSGDRDGRRVGGVRMVDARI